MSYDSWSLGRGGSPYGRGGGGGGTGAGVWGGAERQQDEATFASLFPVNGKVSGHQVKGVFQASGLTQQQLAQIWTNADRDGDGHINVSEFCSAMSAIRQAKLQLQQTSSLQWPSGRGGGGALVGLLPMQSLSADPSQQISKSLMFPSLKEQATVPQSPQAGGARRGVLATPTGSTPATLSEPLKTFEDKRKENFDAGKQELERRRRAIQEKQEREEAERERKRRQEAEQQRQQELEAEKRRQAELERQNRRALEIQRERERQLAKLAEQREAEQREIERKRKEEWAKKRQLELEGVKEWEMKTLRALQSQHSNLENELQQLDQQKMASRDSVVRQSSLCDELRTALRSMRLSDEVKRAEITKLRTELQALQSKLSSLASQRAKFQASLQSRDPRSLQYQKERQVYQDGIMGVAAVLAGLRSTLKSGAESYQKQKELMSNNNTMLSDLQTELQKTTAKSSTLKSQVAHHRTQWDEREKRAREQEKRRKEAEKRQREERERLATEARLEVIKREQKQAIKEAREAREREEKEKEAAELIQLMRMKSLSPPKQATPTKHSTPPTPSRKPDRVPRKPAPYNPPTPVEAVKKLSAILQESVDSTPAGKKEEKAKEKEVKKKLNELKQKKAELDKRPPKPAPYPGKKLKKQNSTPVAKEPPLLDIESSYDSSAQKSGFVPNPQSSFNPLQPQRAGSTTSDTNDIATTELPPEPQSTAYPVVKSGQASLPKTQPLVVDKAKATVTGSQVEALSLDIEPLYAIPHKNRGTNLDYGGSRKTSVQSLSVSPPPKDWVVIGNEEISKKEHPTTRANDVSTTPNQTFVSPPTLWPVTSTPNRVSPSSTAPSDDSAPPPLSSSWVDLQLTANQVRDEPPATRQREDAPSMSSSRAVNYRALYAFKAEAEAELSFEEGEILNGIPGELPSNGWLMVEFKGQQGLAPEKYLEEVREEFGGGEVRSEGVMSGGDVVGGEGVMSGGDVVGGESVTVVSRGSVERELEAASQDVEQTTPNLKAKVLYSWKGSKDSHLAIKKGDIIRVMSRSEKWWSGEKEGKVGWFPKTFVKILEGGEEGKEEGRGSARNTKSPVLLSSVAQPEITPTSPAASDRLYEALYDYDSVEPGDLQFKSGDIIKVTSREGEWWRGTLNGQSGTFPCNYVKPHPPGDSAHPVTSAVPPSPSPSLTSLASDVSITSSQKPVIAKVTRHYEVTKEKELALKPGQYIKVYKQASNGWWYGELQSRGKQRQMGWFPADHVELLQKKADNTPPTSSAAAASSGQLSGQSAGPNVIGAQRARSPLIDILDPPDLSQNLVLALYTYTAASSDELTFHKGSVITILTKKGEWWKGELNGAVGLFPSNYVQPLNENVTAVEATRWAESVSPEVLASVSKNERKRQEAIFELLSSERNYTDSLKFVREVYFEPMENSGVLSAEEVSKVRVNWDELIECNGNMLNAFLVRLRTSGSVVKNLGDILHTQIPLLVPHIRWCSCQLTACTLLQSKSSDPQFKEFEQKCAEDPRAAGLPLSSFLLKPMQRITKYPLLIQKILDYTTEDHVDYEDLKSALVESQRLCHSVNEAVRRKENTEQLEWLQNNVQFSLDERLVFNSQTNFMGQRRLLHWGKLFKIRGNRDLIGFLFNDFFLLVKPKNFFSRAATPTELEPFGKNEFVMYRTPYLLGDIKVNKAPADQHGPSVFLMNYPSEEKDIPLKADSDPARDVWIKVIQDAKHEYLKTKRRSEQEMKKKWAQTMKHSVGVLKVTVVKAEDLKASDPNGKSDPFCVLSFSQQEENTPVVNNNLNPKWNYIVTFAVHDLNEDVLEITVFDKDIFSPNDFLGCGRVVLKDLLKEGDSPWRKQVLLEDVSKGEVELILELTLNKSDLLL